MNPDDVELYQFMGKDSQSSTSISRRHTDHSRMSTSTRSSSPPCCSPMGGTGPCCTTSLALVSWMTSTYATGTGS
jgi:hypothetical protein